jgi:hypothetical protein
MIFWSRCAFIWFKNIEKRLLQMTSGSLQLESTIHIFFTITSVYVYDIYVLVAEVVKI